MDNLVKTLKTLGEFEDSDEVLTAYLDQASAIILNRRHPYGVPDGETVPERYHSLQCDIATYLLGKRGAEGQTSHNENGIDRSYESGYVPESLLQQITPMVGVIR
jgi:hypothetical protein